MTIASRPIKILVGLLTIWPLVYTCLFVAAIGALMFGVLAGATDAQPTPHGMPKWFAAMLLMHLLTMLEGLGILTFCVLYLFRTDRLEQDQKLLWALVLFVGSALAMPIFFWLYMWPEPVPAAIRSDSSDLPLQDPLRR